MMNAIPVRQSARLMLVDTVGRLLLFRYDDGKHPPFWATIGGRVLPGETYEATAARELAEETGYTDAELEQLSNRRIVVQIGVT